MKIGIVGLGLIGGSFALATSRRTPHRVFGYDTDDETMRRAFSDGAIEEALTRENVGEVDVLLLAVVPHLAVEFTRANAERIRGLVIDLCGIKRTVSEAIRPLAKAHGFSYLGGHPMAGREHGGYENAAEIMFDGASMILVPHETIPAWVNGYLEALGFRTVKISTDEEHDRMIAFTSQMAHVVSNNYCKSETGPDHQGFSADSLRDLTRVAGLNAKMWTELFIENGDYLLKEVDRLIEDITKMRNAIADKDRVALERMLEEGSRAKYRLFPKGVACDKYPS